MLFTVVIPAYNAWDSIKRTIESLEKTILQRFWSSFRRWQLLWRRTCRHIEPSVHSQRNHCHTSAKRWRIPSKKNRCLYVQGELYPLPWYRRPAAARYASPTRRSNAIQPRRYYFFPPREKPRLLKRQTYRRAIVEQVIQWRLRQNDTRLTTALPHLALLSIANALS